MSHHIYKTEGYVLGGFPFGEANKFVYLFTRDLGLVGASVQGVRVAKSKLRYSLADYSMSNISLVRGREVWRVVSASEKENLYFLFRNEPMKSAVVARIFSLLKFICTGEEKNEKLFDEVYSALEFLKKENLTNEELTNMERVLALKILQGQGYVKESKKLDCLSAPGLCWSRELLLIAQSLHKEMLFAINESLKASQA